MAEGKVYLIGAGPGDPGLITVKGLRYLQQADVILHDYLANPSLLKEARDDCELIFVGKKHDPNQLTQSEINQILIDKGRERKVVARLKGGDPFIFGRGGEEAEALFDAGIAFEVIPGVSAATAVPAYAGIPMTHRGLASDVAFITGHEQADKDRSDLDWDKLARGVGTLVFFMGVKNLSNITANLIKHGRPHDTPAAVIRWGTLAKQKTIVGTLANIAEKIHQANLHPPAITVIGPVVQLREKLTWFEKKPLFGQRIVVTRPRRQGTELISLLQSKGAESIEFPTIQTVPVADYTILDHSIERLESYDWLIFTSANGVKYFMERLKYHGKDSRQLKNVKIAAVGPATARCLKAFNLIVDLIPKNYLAEGLLKELTRLQLSGRRILLPRAKEGRAILPEQLRAMGAEVTIAPAYQTIIADTEAAPLVDKIKNNQIDWITFTSPSTVRNFIALLNQKLRIDQDLKGIKIAAIGPIAAKAASALNIDVDVVAKKSTNAGLVAAIIQAVREP